MNEAPTVIGMMTSIIESGGSLDVAVRTVAIEGPPLSRDLFEESVRFADTKGTDSLKDSLILNLSRIPEEASGYRQSLMLCISAADSGDQDERLRILKEASDVALESVRIMGERYSTSLTVPCMTVFGLGIMAPMILMSILPLLGIGGLFGSTPIDENIVLLIVLLVIPIFILGMAVKIRSDNPFLENDGLFEGLTTCLPILLSIPLYPVLRGFGFDEEQSILLSVLIASVLCMLLMIDSKRKDSKRRKAENGLRECIFELGNFLLGGDNFEQVSVDVISARPECSAVGIALGREMDLCRGDVCSAIRKAVSPVSEEVSRTLCYIDQCAMKNTEDAGRLAVAIGRQFQNGSNIRKELSLNLKSMTDMMVGTAMFFAPMVLGMSVSMIGPVSEISGYTGLDGTGMMLSIYLVELCALIAILTSSLGDGENIRGAVWRFCTMAPLALIVFTVCMSINLRRD